MLSYFALSSFYFKVGFWFFSILIASNYNCSVLNALDETSSPLSLNLSTSINLIGELYNFWSIYFSF